MEDQALSPEEIQKREMSNLRALLEDDLPVGLIDLLNGVRPFTGDALALMQITQNEWLRRVPADQMASSYFASLSWLYILKGDEREVLQVAFDQVSFRRAVMAFGRQITPEQLAGADALIQHTLGLVDMAAISVKAKNGDPGPDEPPNS
jgi:hypothetical protein